MSALLIGLDNPHSRNPYHALLPMPDGATGDKIVQLIAAVIDGYTARDYLRDFGRLNLYPGEAARSGKGATATDRLLARHCVRIIAEGKYSDVVLLGKRVQVAFSDFVVFSHQVERHEVFGTGFTADFYALPHPSGRNIWYNDEANRARAGRILKSLSGRR
jgi:hypothetical protein